MRSWRLGRFSRPSARRPTSRSGDKSKNGLRGNMPRGNAERRGARPIEITSRGARPGPTGTAPDPAMVTRRRHHP
ncbi:hypothetical protein FXB38_04635 [Bradyrhizobium cytisi]|uniref:Uncharacterized protein n=1 Tax=Bradyrhizobium cytisi TaxID=515489 RepID=A0A5S4X3E2_9BRAD|nr:hypothetical protein FXB38_04635 [Bradyrhizobium cytisi]